MYKYNSIVNPEFQDLTEFVNDIPKRYKKLGRVIYSSRNEIKIVKQQGRLLAIKYYKRINLFNKIYYSIFKVTKANNSNRNSLILISKGINTPAPVGYIDCYKKGIYKKGFFVSLFTDYEPVEDMLSQPVEKSLGFLHAFARFTYEMHQKGVFPGDYSVSNVRFRLTEAGYDFQLIDINRMKIGGFSFKKGSKSLQRLLLSSDKIGIIAAEYARLAKKDNIRVLGLFLFFRNNFLLKMSVKQKLKKIFNIKNWLEFSKYKLLKYQNKQ